MFFGVIFIISVTVRCVFLCSAKNPTIQTKYGPVLGSSQISRNGREYMSYRGIPFAKPPLGSLRFKAPEPPLPWTAPLNATGAPYCIQINYFFSDPKVEGSEDCLYLNIYVPEVPTNKSEELLPVMVFIHWGGFFAGRGSSDIIGPEYLMDKDVILVTFNYRLGVFGFLSTLDDAAPGNFGLKDQVQALKFVQETIEAFGGNRNKVTLFGQSAGSGSTSLHMVSPASQGLFHQAITQSGASLDLWARPLNQLQPNVTAALAVFTGCSEHVGDSGSLVACLREVEAAKLAATADKFKYFSTEPLTVYTIVTENKTEANPQPFLTKDPLEYLQAGEFQKVPWIVGSAQDEGILRVAPLVRQPGTLEALNGNFTTLLAKILMLELSSPAHVDSLLENITDFYLGDRNLIDISDPKSVQGFIDLYTDRSFYYGIYQTTLLQLKKGHKPIWVYNFNYRGQYSYGDKFAATNDDIDFDWGVSHCDDLLYLFRSPALFPDLKEKADLEMSAKMVTMWTDFAALGDPDPLRAIGWKSLNSTDQVQVLHVEGNSQNGTIGYRIKPGFYSQRVQFWARQQLAENFAGLD